MRAVEVAVAHCVVDARRHKSDGIIAYAGIVFDKRAALDRYTCRGAQAQTGSLEAHMFHRLRHGSVEEMYPFGFDTLFGGHDCCCIGWRKIIIAAIHSHEDVGSHTQGGIVVKHQTVLVKYIDILAQTECIVVELCHTRILNLCKVGKGIYSACVRCLIYIVGR